MQLLFRFLSALPLAWLHRLGALAGWIVWLLSPTYRAHLRANLALAYPDPAEARRIARGAIAEIGKGMAELPKMWMRPHAEVVGRVVEVVGMEVLEAGIAAGRGVMIVTPHLGCFEIVALYVATKMPITVLYRPPRQVSMRAVVEIGRARPNVILAPTDLSGVRSLMRALKRAEAIGLLPDQAPSAGQGAWLDFFGRPAYTMTLAARLSETGAAMIFTYAERLPGGRGYRVVFRGPAEPLAGSLDERARQINREAESMIRCCPEQYLWSYNRYKRPAGAEPPPGAAE